MFARTGTRPIVVSGALLAAGGILWLPRIPVDGTYLDNLLARWRCVGGVLEITVGL
jgi:hypothetical protein